MEARRLAREAAMDFVSFLGRSLISKFSNDGVGEDASLAPWSVPSLGDVAWLSDESRSMGGGLPRGGVPKARYASSGT